MSRLKAEAERVLAAIIPSKKIMPHAYIVAAGAPVGNRTPR